MKTFSYLITFCLALVVLISCEDEDRIRIPEYKTAANMRLVVDPEHVQINYQSVSTDYFAFDAYSENKDIDKVEFTVQYKESMKLFRTLGQSDFSTGKARIELHASEFADLFGVPGFADGSRGGNFTIRPFVYLTDGRIYPDYVVVSAQDSFLNVGTGPLGAANGAFTFKINTLITCAPVDISGTYVVVSSKGTSTDGCCPGEVEVSGDIVQVDATSPSTFTVSDITGGMYFEWYDVYGITAPEDSPGNLQFNCGEVLIVDSEEPFGTLFTGSGDYDAATGRITYSWTNGFADEGTVILQRQ